MWYPENEFALKLGSNRYINVPNLIVYKGDNLFTVTRATNNEALGITFKIYDSKGQKIASVNNGQIYPDSTNVNVTDYNVTLNQDEFILIENTSNRTLCKIQRNSKAGIDELNVDVDLFTFDGFRLMATPDGTNVAGAVIRNSTIENCANGLCIF